MYSAVQSNTTLSFPSHLHSDIAVRFLTCEPNLSGASPYTDEADRFYEDPSAWLAAHVPHSDKGRGSTTRNETVSRRDTEMNEEGKRQDRKYIDDSVLSKDLQDWQIVAFRYQYEVLDPLLRLPTHVVMFDSLIRNVEVFLRMYQYEMCGKVFHSYIKDGHRGNYFLVYCLPVR